MKLQRREPGGSRPVDGLRRLRLGDDGVVDDVAPKKGDDGKGDDKRGDD